MGMVSMVMGFWLDNGFQLGKAIKDARRYKANKREIPSNLAAYESNLGEQFAVVETTSFVFGERITGIDVYSKDRICSITLFEDETPMTVEVQSVRARQSEDFYFGNTLKDMLLRVSASEKLEAAEVAERVSTLLGINKIKFYPLLQHAQIEKALLTVRSEISLQQPKQA